MGAGCVVGWSPAVGSVYALWQSKDILFRLTGDSKSGDASEWLSVSLYWPHDGLATCSECTWYFAI